MAAMVSLRQKTPACPFGSTAHVWCVYRVKNKCAAHGKKKQYIVSVASIKGVGQYLIMKYAILTTTASASSLLVFTSLMPIFSLTVLISVNLFLDSFCLVLMSHICFDDAYSFICCGAIACVKRCCFEGCVKVGHSSGLNDGDQRNRDPLE